MRDRNDRGAALLEMAIALPFLVLVVLGVVDFGRALFAQIGLEQAAQEGAIYAAFNPDDYAKVQLRVAEASGFPSLSAADVTVGCPAGPSGGTVEVSVSHVHNLVTPIVSSWFGGSLNLSAQSVAQILTDDPCDQS